MMLYDLALGLSSFAPLLFASPQQTFPLNPTLPPLQTLLPAPAPVKQRLGLSGAIPASLEKSSVRLTIDGANGRGTLPKLWAGITLGSDEAKSPDWSEHAARLAHAGATLVRFAPLSEPGVLSVSAKGEPRVRWELADAALTRAAQKGVSLVLVVDSPPPIAIQGWSDLVNSLAKRYADDARFRVLRWEFAGAATQANIFYPSFAKSVRRVIATAPIGVHFTGIVSPAELKPFAALCAVQKIPFDSVGWDLDANSTTLVAKFMQLRATLNSRNTKNSTNVQLFPELVGDAQTLSPSRAVALIYALFAAIPPNQPNELLGVSLRGSLASSEAALGLLNRLNGLKIETVGNTDRVHVWSTRTPTGIRTLLLNEGAEGYAVLTGKNLAAALPAGTHRIRLTLKTPDNPDAPLLETDFTPIETEIPILLLAKSVLLLEFRAIPESGVQCSLTVPQAVYHTGDEIVLTTNLTLTAPVAKTDAFKLSGFPVGMVPGSAVQKTLTLTPNVARALRSSLLSPISAKPGYLAVTATFGGTKSALLLKQEASFRMKLVTPRVIADAKGNGEATLRLTNDAPLALPMTIRANGTEKKISLPVTKSATEVKIPVSVTNSEPGIYTVPLDLECFGDSAGQVTVQLAVPISAHYRLPVFPLSSFLAGNEWRVSDPFGAGRAEFTGGQKTWKSPGDLSFLGSALWDIDGLTLVFDVTDDILISPPKNDFSHGDSLRLTLATEANPKRLLTADLAFDRTKGTQNRTQFGTESLSAPDISTAALPRKDGLRYAVRILWKTLGIAKPDIGTLLRIGVRLNDVDREGGTSGTLSLSRSGALLSLRLEK